MCRERKSHLTIDAFFYNDVTKGLLLSSVRDCLKCCRCFVWRKTPTGTNFNFLGLQEKRLGTFMLQGKAKRSLSFYQLDENAFKAE